MIDIVEKLKDACVVGPNYGKSVTLTLDYDDYMEAADTITALRAEVERLREFVLFVDKWTNYKPNKPEKPTSYENCVKTIAPMAAEFARALSHQEQKGGE